MTNNNSSASLFKRLAAAIYDTFILISLVILATALALIVNHGDSFKSVQVLFLSYLLIVIGTFLTWFWQKSGQTLGMLSWKIKLVNKHNHCVSWQQAWARWLIAVPCTLSGISWIWCLLDSDKQSLHDRICGTRIINYIKMS